MDGPRHEFLPGATLTLDQNGTVALGKEWQQFEDLPHPMIGGGHLMKGGPAFGGLSEFLHKGEVTEGFNAPDNLSGVIPQECGADADGDFPVGRSMDVHVFVDQR